MNYFVNCFNKTINGEIILPTSKSISNRLLIIKALANHSFQINTISNSDDTRVMLEAFRSMSETVNIGHAGTSMRFLTAYYAAIGQSKIITGSERMQNRPIYELVNGLNQLGAEITYINKTGYPPLKTSGKPLTGNKIEIHGDISSQYITALLLVAPSLPNGLTIDIIGNLISSSYVRMTLELMKKFGINYTWNENTIKIEAQKYSGSDISVEADWSGASYWYQIAALSNECNITLHGLTSNSFQGDAALVLLFERIGIISTFNENSVNLTKQPFHLDLFEFDFINNPDLIQTFVVTLCLMNIPFRISGADTLRIKETDRIAALQIEMKKMGYKISEPKIGTLEWNGHISRAHKRFVFDTYKDHRMAMAFAPVALKHQNVEICDAMVVSKSYPNFWEHLAMVGFDIKDKIV